MKKLVVFFLCGMLLSVFACSENYESQKFYGLKGKVLSIRDTIYEFRQLGFMVLDVPGDISKIVAFDFDREGNLIKNVEYYASGEPFISYTNTYENGVLDSSVWQVYADTIYTTTTKLIRKDGDCIDYEIDNSEQVSKQEVRTSGKYRCYMQEGDWGYTKEELWADRNNNVIKVHFKSEYIGGDEALGEERITTLVYDKDNNEIESTETKNDSTTIRTFLYTSYDSLGNWIERKTKVQDHFKYLTKRSIIYFE